MHALVPALLAEPTPERLGAPLRPRPEARHQALVLLKPECDRKDALGLERVDITANFVHLSAGPLEALWELLNFFGGLETASFRIADSSLAAKWTGDVAVLEARIREGGALFGSTEDLDVEAALGGVEN